MAAALEAYKPAIGALAGAFIDKAPEALVDGAFNKIEEMLGIDIDGDGKVCNQRPPALHICCCLKACFIQLMQFTFQCSCLLVGSAAVD